MTSYKQEIINIINNEDNKKTLSNIKHPYHDNLLTKYLKKYTKLCMDSENSRYERNLKDLYYEIDDIIKIQQYRLNFKNTHKIDLDIVLDFKKTYEKLLKTFQYNERKKFNKKLNDSIEENYPCLYDTIKGDINIDYVCMKFDGKISNVKILNHLHKKYCKKIKDSNIDLKLFE